MSQKGIIMNIERSHVIILTEEHDYLRIKKKPNCQVGQKIFFTEQDILRAHSQLKEIGYMNKKIIAAASVFIMILALVGLFGSGILSNPDNVAIASVVTIDINPSIKLYLNDENQVVIIEAMNHDADELDFEGIIGINVEEAIEKVVILAKEAGYISEYDLEEDYVLITTVSMGDDEEKAKGDENLATLVKAIEEKIANSEELQMVNVAIIKATKVEMLEAEGQDVPIGLLVVQGEIEIDGVKMSVSEYFSASERVESFKDKGSLIEKKQEKRIELAEKFIEKLENEGVNVETLRLALTDTDLDIEVLLAEIKALWEIQEDLKDDDDDDEDDEDEDDEDDEDKDDEDEDDEDDEDEEKTAEEIAEKAAEKAEEAAERAEEKAEKAAEKAEEKAEREAEKAEKAAERAEEKSEKDRDDDDDDDEDDDDDDDDDEDEDDDDEDDQE